MGNRNQRNDNLQIRFHSSQKQVNQPFNFCEISEHQDIVEDLSFPSFIASREGIINYQLTPSQESLYQIDLSQSRQITVTQLFMSCPATEDLLLWKVLNFGQQQALEEGDMLRIGKTKMKLKQIVTGKIKIMKRFSMKHNSTENIDESVSPSKCRVCFEVEQTPQNPLMSLCKCSGSIKYIHYGCVQKWMYSDVQKSQSRNCIVYTYWKPKCELCQQTYQHQLKHGDCIYSLYEFENFKIPYAVFENQEFDQSRRQVKISMYIIMLSDEAEITIGRNTNSKMVLDDEYVSRNHCSLTYKYNKLYIQDRKSTYGTLIHSNRQFQFDENQSIKFLLQEKQIKICLQHQLEMCCPSVDNNYSVEIVKSNALISQCRSASSINYMV